MPRFGFRKFATRDYHFLDLLGAVANMQAHHLAQALLEWHVHRVAEMPVQLQAQVDSLEGELWWPPFAHGCFRRVRASLIA